MPTLLARRFVVVALALLVLAAVAGYATWVGIGSAAAREVSLSWTPACHNTQVSTYDGAPVIEARDGWRCDIDVTVDNRSGHDLSLTQVGGYNMGHESGLEVTGFSNADSRFVSVEEDAGVSGSLELDGHWDVALVVPAHTSRELTLTVGWNVLGCDIASTVGLPAWPRISFSVAGREHHASADQTLSLRKEDNRKRRHCTG